MGRLWKKRVSADRDSFFAGFCRCNWETGRVGKRVEQGRLALNKRKGSLVNGEKTWQNFGSGSDVFRSSASLRQPCVSGSQGGRGGGRARLYVQCNRATCSWACRTPIRRKIINRRWKISRACPRSLSLSCPSAIRQITVWNRSTRPWMAIKSRSCPISQCISPPVPRPGRF